MQLMHHQELQFSVVKAEEEVQFEFLRTILLALENYILVRQVGLVPKKVAVCVASVVLFN